MTTIAIRLDQITRDFSTGRALEHTGFYEHLSASDNLEYYGRINRLSPADRAACIKELLTNIGLWDRRHEHVGKWSKGMQQKLALARAMLHRPSLLLLDEPTAGLVTANALTIPAALRRFKRARLILD